MSLRDHFQAIYDENGKLTPELVVDVARREEHPLHTHFQWDDTIAAEQWRRHQAAELIRSVRIVYREAAEGEDSGTIRAFHSVRTPKGNTYEPAERIRDDPFTRQLVLNDMRREWLALKRRYEQFAEFVEMVRSDLAEAA